VAAFLLYSGSLLDAAFVMTSFTLYMTRDAVLRLGHIS